MDFEQEKKIKPKCEGAAARTEIYNALDVILSETVESFGSEGIWSPLSMSLDFAGEVKSGKEHHLKVTLTRRTKSILFLSAFVECEGKTIVSSQAIWGRV